MAKQKTERLNFSKFFPESTSYVSVTGSATSPEDFSVNVKIGDGTDAVSLFTSDWFKDDGLATLKAIQEGVQKAIDFHQKALKLPKVETPSLFPLWDTPAKMKTPKRVLRSTETVVKKKAAPKKK